MTLKDYFLNNDGRNMIHKPMSYFDIYERYFSRSREELDDYWNKCLPKLYKVI